VKYDVTLQEVHYTFKIISLLLATSIAASPLYARQIKEPKEKTKRSNSTTIGFRSGRALFYSSTKMGGSKQIKTYPGISNSLFARKPIYGRVSLEGGATYTMFRKPVSLPFKENKNLNSFQAYNIALPVTVNYFFLPGHCCIHPYIGAGFQYNLTPNNRTGSPFNNESNVAYQDNQQGGTKYISLLFTQGVTFQVNTKIQINQSVHFAPGNNNRVIGIDLGIGCQLP